MRTTVIEETDERVSYALFMNVCLHLRDEEGVCFCLVTLRESLVITKNRLLTLSAHPGLTQRRYSEEHVMHVSLLRWL